MKTLVQFREGAGENGELTIHMKFNQLETEYFVLTYIVH